MLTLRLEHLAIGAERSQNGGGLGGGDAGKGGLDLAEAAIRGFSRNGLGQLLQRVLGRGALGLQKSSLHRRDQVQPMNLIVGDFQEGHPGEGAHLGGIAGDEFINCGARGRILVAGFTAGEHEGGRHALQVPLEGPRMVSSKSLMSKVRRPSGAAKAPRLRTWASPQSWLMRPVEGRTARSAAITGTAPRK